MSILAPIIGLLQGVVDLIAGIGAGVTMLGDALLGALRANGRARRRILQQMAFVGFESVFIVLVTMLFGGAVMAFQSAKQLVTYGGEQFVGSIVTISMARELAPMLTAMMVAARIGSAFAAELGTMRITGQIDALRSLATSPVRYLVTPRLVATAVMLPILTMYANLAGDFGGALVSQASGVSYHGFLDSAKSYLDIYDINAGLLKAVVFGILITITSCYIGLRTDGGATGVGKATTSAVVWSIIFIYASNYLLSWLLYAFRH